MGYKKLIHTEMGEAESFSLEFKEEYIPRKEKSEAKFIFDSLSKDIRENRLSTSETLELFNQYDGNPKVKNKIISGNLGLITLALKELHISYKLWPDLFQEGVFGLDKVVDKYDYRLGYKFSTYAMWYIKSAIQRARGKIGYHWYIPVYILEIKRKIEEYGYNIWKKYGRETSYDEICRALLYTPKKIMEVLDATENAISLNTRLKDKNAELIDFIPNEPNEFEDFETRDFEDELDSYLNRLTDKQKGVLRLRFGVDGVPRLREEIGKIYGVGRERVRQIQDKAFHRLRGMRDIKDLKPYAYDEPKRVYHFSKSSTMYHLLKNRGESL